GTRTPASTASRARPPALKTFHASAFAATPKFQVERTIGFSTLPVLVLPIALPKRLVNGRTAAPMAEYFRRLRREVCLVSMACHFIRLRHEHLAQRSVSGIGD